MLSVEEGLCIAFDFVFLNVRLLMRRSPSKLLCYQLKKDCASHLTLFFLTFVCWWDDHPLNFCVISWRRTVHRICSFVDETITFEVFVFIYCQILYKSTVTVAHWVKPVDPKTKVLGSITTTRAFLQRQNRRVQICCNISLIITMKSTITMA